MNILLLGSGGREHALAWKMKQSLLLDKLYIAPGNPGTASAGINVNLSITDFPAIREFVLQHKIELVVVGPEDPLVKGIHDFFLADEALSKVSVIGPVKKGAILEGSKDFAKQFMTRYGIPTAGYRTFTKKNLTQGIDHILGSNPPYVLKADGLAAGKGVVICQTPDEAIMELKSMLIDEKFGNASEQVVIEEYLKGIELSVFVLTDGKSYKILPEAKDYKRVGEGDQGPNTGGMGSVSPVSFAGKGFMDKVEHSVIRPTMAGLLNEGVDYRGFIFFGLIKVGDDPFVIEYNCRLGDPEAESVLPRIENDLVELFDAVGKQHLEKHMIKIDPRFAATIVMVSGGYPGNITRGIEINGLEQITKGMIFHAGTTLRKENGQILTNGGRVLALTSLGKTMKEALEISYDNAKTIGFEGKYYRNDIGFDI